MKEKSEKKVGIIGRGSHGYQSAEEMSRKFRVSFAVLPEKLPEVIESFEELLPLLEFKKGKLEDLLNSDLLICYANHPDVSLILAEVFDGLLILMGNNTGSKKQLRRVKDLLLTPEICCVVREVEGYEWFFENYGKPEFEFSVKNEKIVKAEVKRCAFCGATRFVAEKLSGVKISEAPRLAGLYTQIYPCLATRGIEGGIHLAAEMHRLAAKRAIDKTKTTSFS